MRPSRPAISSHTRIGSAGVTLVALLTAACSGGTTDPVAPSAGQIRGRYVLRTVDGQSLPAPVHVSSAIIAAVADTLTLAADGTFTELSVTQTTYPSTYPSTPVLPSTRATYTRDGTWSLAATTLTLSYQSHREPGGGVTPYAAQITGTVGADAQLLTVTQGSANGPRTFVFGRL